MNVFAILCLLLQLAILNAAPVSTNSFYDAIVKSCPYSSLYETSFKNQSVFEKCRDWQNIDKTNNFTRETERNVLCLLYYNSLITFCDQLKTREVKNINVTQLIPDLNVYQIKNVCKNLTLVPDSRDLKHNINKIINKEDICIKLCTDYDASLVPECGLAYYFASYNYSRLVTTAVQNVVPSPELNSSKDKFEALIEPIHSQGLGVPSLNVQPQIPESSVQISNRKTSNQHTHQSLSSDSKQAKEVIPAAVQQQDAFPATGLKNSEEKFNITLGTQNRSHSIHGDGKSNVEPLTSSKSTSAISDKPTNLDTANEDPAVPNETFKNLDTAKEVEKNLKANAVESVKSTATSNSEDISVNEQHNVDAGNVKPDVDQQNSLDALEDNMLEVDQSGEPEDGNDGNYKEGDEKPLDGIGSTREQKKEKPITSNEEMPANYNTTEDLDGESYFFSYFMVICVLFVLGYVGYHNRQKVMGLMLEGKPGRRQVRTRRPNSANYHKLDSNLEEAISSTCTKNSSHVIY